MRARLLFAAVTAPLVMTAVVAGWSFGAGQGTTQASPAVTLGIDVDPAGNSATSLGSIETSRTVACGDTFDVDIYITDVTDLIVWYVLFRYDPTILYPDVHDVQMFLAAAPGSNVLDHSDGDPDLDGRYDLLAADDAAPETGSGVLARLTMTAVAMGTTALTLEDRFLVRAPFNPIPVGSMFSADITVSGGACPGDTDGDAFGDDVEAYLGTDPDDACPDSPSHDAWPLDIDMSTDIDVSNDVFNYVGRIGATPGDPMWWQRLDLDASGDIDVSNDVFMFVGRIGDTCT